MAVIRCDNSSGNACLTCSTTAIKHRATNILEEAMLKLMTAALAAIFALTGAATAQDYPNRPVTMVIPFAAGGPTDVLGRVVA
jgi:hypothetical protein